MKKLVRNKTLRSIVIAAAINLIWLFLLIKMFEPGEKTDDMIMKYFLSGAFSGEVSPYVQYSSIFLGYMLAFFQRLIPSIPWYEAGQYILMYASFVMVSYIVIKSKPAKYAALILAPVFLFWEYDAYIKLTFTKTSGIGMVVGLLVMLYGMKQKTKLSIIPHTIIGAILVVGGSLYRFKTLKALVVLFIGVFVCELICRIWDERKRKDFKLFSLKYLKALIPVAVILIVFAGCLGAHKASLAVMRMDKSWNEYRDFNTYKVPLQDYGWPDYYTNYEAYTELGISYNDYVLWANHRDYGEPSVLTTELLKKVYELKGEADTFDGKLQEYFEAIPDFLEEYPVDFLYVKYMIPTVLFLLFFVATNRKGKWLYIACIFAVLMLQVFYLFAGGRYGRDHVDYCIWFGVAMAYVYLIHDVKIAREKLFLMGMTVAAALIFWTTQYKSYISNNTYTGQALKVKREFAQADLNFLSSGTSNLYVLSSGEYTGLLGSANTAFASPAAGSMSNIYILSGYMYLPFQEMLERYGVNNIYEDLCLKDNVYFVCRNVSYAESILLYIREHYDPMANCYAAVPMVGGYYIYNFYIDNDLSDDDFLASDIVEEAEAQEAAEAAAQEAPEGTAVQGEALDNATGGDGAAMPGAAVN